jgi:hypothetical protein
MAGFLFRLETVDGVAADPPTLERRFPTGGLGTRSTWATLGQPELQRASGLRRAGLMARDREVASRVRTRLFVLLERERDARKAARIAALTEKRDRISELELACLRGDSLVRLAKDVLCSHG